MSELMNQTVIEQARRRFGAHMAARERAMIEAVASGDNRAMNQLDELPRYVSRFVQMRRPELAAELLGEVAEGQGAPAAVLEWVIEQNELMAASFFARGLAASRAVGRIVLRNAAGQTRGFGTGFMISPRLMMTNNHVLASEAVAARSIIEFDYACGVDGQPMQVKRFALDPAAFSPAPLAEEIALPQGALVGPDGGARWNLQLSLGPVTQGATPPPPAPAPVQESVFAPRGPYFDDATEAPLIDAYYAGIDADLSKDDLYDALQQLVGRTHHTVLSYARARHEHLYPWIDRHEDTALRSIYSGAPMAEELFVAELQIYEAALMREAQIVAGAMTGEMIDNVDLALENSAVFNCEHVVPQSWFADAVEKRAQKADMHHLFTCDSGCNSFRSNIPYSEFSPEEEERLRAAELSLAEAILDPTREAARPSCGLRDDRRFEPEAGKGAVARATLYFVLRYPGVVGDIKTGRKKEFVKSNVDMLLDWAETDPPGRYEQHRNAEIAKIQGNRNPLIDHPEWLRKIAFERGFA